MSIDEIDGATKEFHVRAVRRRALREVSNEILRIAAKHNFASACVVVVE